MPRGYPIKHTYSDDDLRAALPGARSWRHVERRLGLVHGNTVTRKIRARAQELGLDTSSFVWGNTKYDEAMLREAVAKANCYSDVLRLLGLKLAGGNHAHISRRIRHLELDISHFDPNANHRCGPSRRRSPEEILVRLEPGSKRTSSEALRRAMHASSIPDLCATCGCGPEWLGQFLRLEIDHIDGDWLNNLIENLRFLCPNCHTQTETFARYKRRQAS